MSPEVGAVLRPPSGSLKSKISPEYEVFFSKSGLTVTTDGATSLLDLAEAHGVDIDFGCRGGGCGRCKVRCLKGEVFMTTDDGLEHSEKGAGFVLSCIGCPRSNTVISA